jgi:glutamine amidotransferase
MIAIIDFKAGNLTSVKLAMKTIGVDSIITSDPEVVRKSERVIFPGVGAAGAAMHNLTKLGLDIVLCEVAERGTPLLGICVGMQVMLDYSEEDNGTKTLGLIKGQTIKFQPKNHYTKVPQIGWNSVNWNTNPNIDFGAESKTNSSGRDFLDKKFDAGFFAGLQSGSDFYFVHSYYPVPQNPENILATTEYAGVNFASIIQHKNIIATQFHPEKSGRIGLQFLANFCKAVN